MEDPGGEEFRYRPVSVRELLKDMVNKTYLMVDLAYCSVIYGDEGLARVVLELARGVDDDELGLAVQASLASRNLDEALRCVSLYKLASSLKEISDAARDIARMALDRIRIPPSVSLKLLGGEELVSMVEVRKPAVPSKLCGELGVVVDVLAVKRGGGWVLQPPPDTEVRPGDVLVVAGSAASVEAFRRALGAPPPGAPAAAEDALGDLVEHLYQMRNTSLVMIDLAYMALLMRSEDVARKVVELEEYMDGMLGRFEEFVLSSGLDVEGRLGALRIAYLSEAISDAASEMVTPMLRGLEPHPILDDVFWETNERISVIEMDSSDEGKTLSELGYSRKGIVVLAVRRGDWWYVMPPYSSFRVRAGDVLIVKYYAESEGYVEEEESEEDREEIMEEIREEEWEEE